MKLTKKAYLLLSLAMAIFLSACNAPPANLNLDRDRAVANNLYRVSIRPVSEPFVIAHPHPSSPLVRREFEQSR